LGSDELTTAILEVLFKVEKNVIIVLNHGIFAIGDNIESST
jgi:hypothetical protein